MDSSFDEDCASRASVCKRDAHKKEADRMHRFDLRRHDLKISPRTVFNNRLFRFVCRSSVRRLLLTTIALAPREATAQGMST